MHLQNVANSGYFYLNTDGSGGAEGPNFDLHWLSDGSGHIGPSGGALSWDAGNNVTINAGSFFCNTTGAGNLGPAGNPRLWWNSTGGGAVGGDGLNSGIFTWTPTGGWSVGLSSGGQILYDTTANTLLVNCGGTQAARFNADYSGFCGVLSQFAWNANGSSAITCLAASGRYFGVSNHPSGGALYQAIDLQVDGSGNLGPTAWNAAGRIISRFDIQGSATGGLFYHNPYSAISGGTALMLDSTSGAVGPATSSRRYKTAIRPLSAGEAREMLLKLQPVLYRSLCDYDDPTVDHIGLIAEDVAEICPWLVNYDADGQPQSVRYEKLPVLQLAARM
jgi:hypothetical protein